MLPARMEKAAVSGLYVSDIEQFDDRADVDLCLQKQFVDRAPLIGVVNAVVLARERASERDRVVDGREFDSLQK